MYKVAVVGPIHEEGMKLFRSRSDVEAHVLEDLSPAGIARGVTGVDAINIRTQSLPREVLALAPGLRIVSRHGVGFDNVDVAYLSSRKIPMAIAADANYTAVAEEAVTMMLCLLKNVAEADAAVRAGDFAWRNTGVLSDLMDRHVLVLGFGRIGQRVATLCQAFGAKVSAYDPYVTASPVPGVEMTADYKALLPKIDILTLHLPSLPETVGMIGAAELATMKPTALVVNTARGGIVDEDALAAALRDGVIGGAGLDVFLKEPHDHTHPLFAQKHCVFSPHAAALTRECAVRMAVQSARNILDCLDGKLDPRVVVNRKAIGL
ncbi:putative d-3-phosphoglycerate dehydrogenase [uncultured Alphaproteobacteria bacterium]|jgi:D-3-phosphoglycerate dehydrogenase|uniref:Putative d-3-phosphoglycerate dehydrogenase n=1 Tax=uncultured Alphaproteobacteria bacterium TaxID=91750 RepID=A0A212KMF3_9PROT|nr:putative d-3-phosphoglycerate dehydrogenase [uncultured Alphaproteobacteria bacterium]